jgi:hypothetical protein
MIKASFCLGGAAFALMALAVGAACAGTDSGDYNYDPAPRAAPAMVPVGHGTTDPSPRQLVRSSKDVLYVIAPSGDVYTSSPPLTARLIVWGADKAGTPTRFAALDNAHSPGHGVNASASAIDGADQIHSLWITPGAVNYGVFDTGADVWRSAGVLAQTGWTQYGQGDEGAALAVDASGAPYAVWNYVDSSGALRLHLAIMQDGAFGAAQQVDDVDVMGGARHPSVAFAPNGDFVVAWIDSDGGYSSPGVVRTRVLHPNGQWDPSYAVPGETAGGSLDQSCSLLITADGVRHISFLNDINEVRYYYDSGSGWTGDEQPPYQITHDPVLGPDGAGGLYIYGHGTPVPDYRGLGRGKFRFHKPAGATTWSPYELIRDGNIDDASNARWSQFFDNHPEEVDFTWWNYATGPGITPDAQGYFIETGVQTVTARILAGAIDLQANADSDTGGTAEAFQATANGAGAPTRIGLYVDDPNQTSVILLGLYSDAGGQPGQLLAQGTLQGLGVGHGQWHEAALSPSPTLAAGQPYWIAVLSPKGKGPVGFRDTAGGTASVVSASTTLKALPTSWTSGASFANSPIAAYLTGP